MIFVPEAVGIDGFSGGFAISLVSIVVAITAVVVGIMYSGWAAQVSKISRGEGVLAHWIYPPEFWAQYAHTEYSEEISEKRGLFIIISGFALFFGALFWGLDEEAGLVVFLVMLCLIGLCAFAWRFTAWSNCRQNRRLGIKEVYLTKDGVYLNRKLFTWHGWLTRFESATLNKNGDLTLIVFKYTGYGGRAGAQTYLTRVPVPFGQEGIAQNVVTQINLQN